MISEERKKIIQHFMEGGEIQSRGIAVLNRGIYLKWRDFDSSNNLNPLKENKYEEWRIKPEAKEIEQ